MSWLIMEFSRPVASLVITTAIVSNGEMRVIDSTEPMIDKTGLRTVSSSRSREEPITEELLLPAHAETMYSFEGVDYSAPNVTRVHRSFFGDRARVDLFTGNDLLFTLEATYDDQGRHLQTIQTTAGGLIDSNAEALRTLGEGVAADVVARFSSAPLSTVVSRRDDQGRLIEWRHEMLGQVIGIRRLVYREDGLLEGESDSDFDENELTTETRYEYEFNKEGDWIKQTALQKTGDTFVPVMIVRREIVYRSHAGPP